MKTIALPLHDSRSPSEDAIARLKPFHVEDYRFQEGCFDADRGVSIPGFWICTLCDDLGTHPKGSTLAVNTLYSHGYRAVLSKPENFSRYDADLSPEHQADFDRRDKTVGCNL